MFLQAEMPNRVKSLAECLIVGINQQLLFKIPEIVTQAQDEVRKDYLTKYPDSKIPGLQGQIIPTTCPIPELIEPSATLRLPTEQSSNFLASTMDGQFFKNGCNVQAYSDSGFGSESVGPPSGPMWSNTQLEMFGAFDANFEAEKIDPILDFTFSAPEPEDGLANEQNANEQNMDVYMGYGSSQ
jgi:hypothetical protein